MVVNSLSTDERIRRLAEWASKDISSFALSLNHGLARRVSYIFRSWAPSSLLKKCVYAKMTVVFPCGLVL